MADPKAIGKTFAEQLLARIPEDKREAAAAFLQDDTIVEALGTREAALDDWHSKLDEWHKANVKPAADPKPAFQSPATAAFTLDDVKKEASKIAGEVIAKEMQGAAEYIDVVTGLGIDHFREFGTRLDVAELRRDPEVARLGIMGVYEKIHGPKVREKRDAAATAAAAAKEAEIRADERRKVAKESPGPYPVSGREPSVLDAIKPDPSKVTNLGPSVDELTDAYEAEVARLQRQQTAGAAV